MSVTSVFTLSQLRQQDVTSNRPTQALYNGHWGFLYPDGENVTCNISVHKKKWRPVPLLYPLLPGVVAGT